MPANSAPPTAPMPPTTVSANTCRLCTSSKLPDWIGRELHRRRARRRDRPSRRRGRTRAASCRSRFMPSVAQAASLSFMAMSRRPNRPRRIATTASDDEREPDRADHDLGPRIGRMPVPNSLSGSTATVALGEQVDVEEVEDRELGHREDPAVEDHRERRGAERQVDAREPQRGERDRARRPRRRSSDGPDRARADRPPWPRWAMTSAPMPAKLSWHSEIWPP